VAPQVDPDRFGPARVIARRAQQQAERRVPDARERREAAAARQET
jgi:hypothetical protein